VGIFAATTFMMMIIFFIFGFLGGVIGVLYVSNLSNFVNFGSLKDPVFSEDVWDQEDESLLFEVDE